jgi:hypothetical protein
MMIGMITRWVPLLPQAPILKMEDGDEEMEYLLMSRI